MTLRRFIDLWIHRYHKYSDIARAISHWVYLIGRVWLGRLQHPQRQAIGLLMAEHLGDIVACEPLSREIKQLYPNSTLYWIVRQPYRELVDYNPQIDHVLIEYNVFESILLTRWTPFHHFYNCHLPGLRRYNYLNQPLDNPLGRSLGLNVHTYYNHGNLLKVFAEVAGLPVVDETPRLYIPQTVVSAVDRLALPTRFIVLHCHSNQSSRDWQVAHWERLIDELLDRYNYQVVEIGLKSTLVVHHPGYHNLCGQLSLLETAEVIRRGQYFIGIDSGPAHFANAVGTYGILLLGKLNEFEDYMPYSGAYKSGGATFVIQEGASSSELPYQDVWQAVTKTILSTSPTPVP